MYFSEDNHTVATFFILTGMLVGCMPNIVSEGPGASMIVATPEWRANIRLIVSYGTCTPEHRGYMLVDFQYSMLM